MRSIYVPPEMVIYNRTLNC